MKHQIKMQTAAITAALCAVGVTAGAQGYSPFQGAISSPIVVANSPYYDPIVAVTPGGMQALRSGFYGPTGYYPSGYDSPANWDILRAAYARGAMDALNAVAPAETVEPAPDPTIGMSATPRGAVSRVPHGSDGVRAWRIPSGQVMLRWQGDGRIASSVTFQITDRSGRALRGTTVDQLPAEVKFTPPANAAYYQAIVHYVDGATNTIMGKLPR
jgi:hypothetical protein